MTTALFSEPATAERLERAAAALTDHGFAAEILDGTAAARARVQDLDGETVRGQRSGRPLQALCGRRVGEGCGRYGGGHDASCVLWRYDNVTAGNVRRRASLTFRRAVLSNW